MEAERDVEALGRIEAEVARLAFPASKRTLIDALGGLALRCGRETLELDRIIAEMEVGEFSTPEHFLRDLGGELARRIRG